MNLAEGMQEVNRRKWIVEPYFTYFQTSIFYESNCERTGKMPITINRCLFGLSYFTPKPILVVPLIDWLKNEPGNI